MNLTHEGQRRDIDLLWPGRGRDLRGERGERRGGEERVFELRVAEEGEVAFSYIFVEARDDDLGAEGEAAVGLCETRMRSGIVLQGTENMLSNPKPLDGGAAAAECLGEIKEV